jgi:lysozyme family protein
MSRPLPTSDLVAAYEKKFGAMRITRGPSVDAAARRVMRGAARYKAIEKQTGVPWYFIGVLHDRECACDFRGCLHNGQKIIGTKRKTTIVPKGCGPFATFEESAIDALRMKGIVGRTGWTIGHCLYFGEIFNGLGYRNHGWTNPYLWSGSQHYTKGKYIRDHVYNANVIDPQVGIGPVMARVIALDGGNYAPSPLEPNAKGKISKADKKAIVKNSRALRWGEWYTNFCEYIGLSGGLLATLIPTVTSFVTDWRTLTVAAVLGGGYLAMKLSKFNLINAAKEGRYIPSGGFWNIPDPITIPAADGAADPAPPSPDAEATVTDPSMAVPSAPIDDEYVRGLGTPNAVEVVA